MDNIPPSAIVRNAVNNYFKYLEGFVQIETKDRQQLKEYLEITMLRACIDSMPAIKSS